MVLPRGQPILETNGLCRLCGWVVGYRDTRREVGRRAHLVVARGIETESLDHAPDCHRALRAKP